MVLLVDCFSCSGVWNFLDFSHFSADSMALFCRQYGSDGFVTFNNFRDELASSVAVVREKNNNSLTGLTVPSIINMVDKVLKEKSNKKQGNSVA
jgi:hypothetical protein